MRTEDLRAEALAEDQDGETQAASLSHSTPEADKGPRGASRHGGSGVEVLDCSGARVGGKREVVLIFDRARLLYDIRNYCYIEGDIMPEEGQHSRHMVQDVGEEGNVDRVTRVLDLAHADVVERLYPFTQYEIERPVQDNRLCERRTYGIVLLVPESFSQTTVNLLVSLIHELFVCTATADWLSITNPKKADVWRAKAEMALGRVLEIRRQRRERVRIRSHWF